MHLLMQDFGCSEDQVRSFRSQKGVDHSSESCYKFSFTDMMTGQTLGTSSPIPHPLLRLISSILFLPYQANGSGRASSFLVLGAWKETGKLVM